MIKALMFGVITLFFFSCNHSIKEKKNERITLYDIIFADGFDNDDIVFSVNGNKILSQTLSSDKIVGLASLSCQVINDGEKTVLVNSDKKGTEQIIDISKKIELSVMFNKELYKMKIDKDSGRYILIEADSQIIFNQQKKRPIFD